MEKKKGIDTYSSVGDGGGTHVVSYEYTDVTLADFDEVRQDAVKHVAGRRLSAKELEELHAAQASKEGAAEFSKRHRELPIRAAGDFQSGSVEKYGDDSHLTGKRSHVIFDHLEEGQTGKAKLTTYAPVEKSS